MTRNLITPSTSHSKREERTMSPVNVTSTKLTINKLECTDPEVVTFFNEIGKDSLEASICHALSLGVVGLRAMGVAAHVEVVEREFSKMMTNFSGALTEMERQLLERVDVTFDPDQANSVSARLGSTVADAYQGTSRVLEEAKSQLEKLVSDSFNPDLATSSVFKIAKLVNETKAELERAFDPAYEGSYLSKLAATVDEYFGEDGVVADVVEAQVQPVKDELMAALKELRDLVVGQAASAEARRMSSQSGADFEDEIEAELRRLAKAFGDTVERVGNEAGDSGRSKKGDFVVQLAEGPRFTIEAKDYSNPVNLRGGKGILASLTESMVNRGAGFAIAVMKEQCGFPKEVGLFNTYDGDKVLCCFEQDGQFLDVAYRWARTVLLASTAKAVDVAQVEAGLDEARSAIREISKITAKANAILKTADEINSIVAWQTRKALAGLDQASGGLVTELQVAS